MITMKRYALISVSLIMLGILGCSSTPKVVEYPATADPTVEIAKTNDKLNIAKTQQVDVLSPSNYENAMEYFEKAKKQQSKNKSQKDVLHSVAVANTYLDMANESSNLALEALSKVATERENAINAEAPKYFKSQFNDIDDDLKDATSAIEKKRNFSRAEKDRADLESRYNKIELQSIKQSKIGMAKDQLKQAIDQGAKKMAPITLDWAEKKIATSEAMIDSDRHNTARVDDASREAIMASERLLRIVQLAKNSKELNPEQNALRLEQTQNKIVESDRALDATKSELEKQKEQARNLSAENAELESQTRLDNQFKAASQMFSKAEATVFKQEDKIWIRLNGLTFASNKSDITADKFPLLTKVETVIHNNSPCTVTIDGHTDSSGSKQLNIKLSQARAQSVADFFIANNTIMRERVSVRGLGDAYPIATNKTLKGRMLNRRVEVIITPIKALTLH